MISEFDKTPEKRRRDSRNLAAAVAAFAAQGLVLAHALGSDGSVGVWSAWATLVVVLVAAFAWRFRMDKKLAAEELAERKRRDLDPETPVRL